MTALLMILSLAAAPNVAVDLSRDDLVGVVDPFGSIGSRVIGRGESLIEIAREQGVGFNEIEAANPRLDPFVPEVGATAVIPTAWILPSAAARGTLVVNLSEMRLYWLPRAPGPVVTYPVGVALEPQFTPLGTLKVIEKTANPTWYPTAAIRREEPELPAAVPPGPDNPLGSHALRLSKATILIHGTNMPYGVGRKVSHGCLRLYPDDIPRLFELIEVGTSVRIVREPVKVGLRLGRVYVEIHGDEAAPVDALAEATRLLERRRLLRLVDRAKLRDAARAGSGLPVDVTADPSGSRLEVMAGRG